MKKITQEELEQIHFLLNEYNKLLMSVGEIEINIISLNEQKNSLFDEIKKLNKQIEKIKDDLLSKYGEGNYINIETGLIEPIS